MRSVDVRSTDGLIRHRRRLPRRTPPAEVARFLADSRAVADAVVE
ncbi:hypothetical protein [Streptomyces sp. NPDC001985]